MKNDKKRTTAPSAAKQEDTVIKTCYRYIAVRDTYDIKMIKNGKAVNGTMRFKNFEKDGSTGSIDGSYQTDNLIKLIYRFESEGTKSIREIYLKDNGETIQTGVGEEGVKGDSAFIKQPDQLSFTGPVYKKADCNALH